MEVMTVYLFLLLSFLSVVLYIRKRFVDRVRLLPHPNDIDTFGLFGEASPLIRQFMKGSDFDHPKIDKGLEKVKVDKSRLTLDDLETILLAWKHRSGIVTFWDGPYPFVVVTSPEAAETILSSTNLRKNVTYDSLLPWLQDSVFTSWGTTWAKKRNIVFPIYHSKLVKFAPSVLQIVSNSMIKAMKSAADSNGGISDIRDIAIRASFAIIYQVATGNSIDTSQGSIPFLEGTETYRETAVKFATNLWKPITRLTQEGRRLYRDAAALHSLTVPVIVEKLETAKKNSIPTETSFVDALIVEHLKNRRNFSQDDIRKELDAFLLKGQDSTAWTLIWTLFLLGHHQNIQEKLREEVDKFFESRKSHELPLDDLSSDLPYLTAVIKESMRMYPAVPVISRRIEGGDIRVGQYLVPSGCQVYISTVAVNRNPLHWKDTNKFIPERFLQNDSSKNQNGHVANGNCTGHNSSTSNGPSAEHPLAYLPFSGGPRKCPGQEFALLIQKALVATVVRNFSLTSLDSVNDHTPCMGIFTKTIDPIKIRVEARNIAQWWICDHS